MSVSRVRGLCLPAQRKKSPELLIFESKYDPEKLSWQIHEMEFELRQIFPAYSLLESRRRFWMYAWVAKMGTRYLLSNGVMPSRRRAGRLSSLSATELDAGDQKEIYEFVLNHPDHSTVSADVYESVFPYTFDETRVEQAIYSQTLVQDPASSGMLWFKKWSDWPQDVAAEKFRILLAQWPYMNLYAPEDPNKVPLKDFKKELFRQVRNTGILAYRVVVLRDRSSLEAGKTYALSDLVYYPPRNLVRFDILRDRGIKVLATGCGDLEPVEKTIREHFVNSWRSAKQKEADLKVADSHLEIARIKNQARVRAQQNMIYHLTQVLENQEYPREALAMLIYQELEAAAANPETRKLLPADTLNLLTGIGTLLLPRDKNSERPRGGMPIIESDQ